MVVGKVRPTQRLQLVYSLLESRGELSQHPNLIPQGLDEMINVKDVLKITAKWNYEKVTQYYGGNSTLNRKVSADTELKHEKKDISYTLDQPRKKSCPIRG